MILGETFDHATLRSSLGRVLATGPDGHPDCGYNATVEVIAPKVIEPLKGLLASPTTACYSHTIRMVHRMPHQCVSGSFENTIYHVLST